MTKLLFCSLFLLGGFAFAESVDVKGADVGNEEGTTTIEIKKSKGNNPTKAELVWEFTDGTSDVEGEGAAITKTARESWKKACDSWKKEFREDNKENRIINLNCGVPSCGGPAGNLVCSSKANYKIKSRMN